MVNFSSLIISLSFVISFIILAIAAELYYLLCYKKRITNRDIEEDNNSPNYPKKIPLLFFWKNLSKKAEKPDIPEHDPDQLELGSERELLQNQKGVYGEESTEPIDTELMRIHNLCGPPRFLFTITEESKEDLESETGRSRKGSRTRSLSDVVFMETPVLTPLASPCLKSNFNNPLFENLSEAEVNSLRASPPPKFKFLRDAEEKLMRRLMEEAERKGIKEDRERENGLIRIKQVLPLSSSPSKLSEINVHGLNFK